MSRARDLANFGNGIDAADITDATITAGKLAAGAVEGALVTATGRRNLIINGAMQVAQRGTSWSNTTSSTYYLDRWSHQNRQSSVTDIDLVTNQDIGDGIMNVYKITVDTAPADTNFLINQYIENGAYTVLGKDITISWYARQSTGSGVTTNVAVEVDSGSTYNGTGSANSLTSSWQRFTQTFTMSGYTAAGVTSPTLRFQLFFKSLASTDVVELTGVQLEVGSVATPFEHRSYGEELALCQRYFYKIAASGSSAYLCDAFSTSTTQAVALVNFPVTMRSAPTVSRANIATNTQLRHTAGTNNLDTDTGIAGVPTIQGASVFITTSGIQVGSGFLRAAGSTEISFSFDSEL